MVQGCRVLAQLQHRHRVNHVLSLYLWLQLPGFPLRSRWLSDWYVTVGQTTVISAGQGDRSRATQS